MNLTRVQMYFCIDVHITTYPGVVKDAIFLRDKDTVPKTLSMMEDFDTIHKNLISRRFKKIYSI